MPKAENQWVLTLEKHCFDRPGQCYDQAVFQKTSVIWIETSPERRYLRLQHLKGWLRRGLVRESVFRVERVFFLLR